MLESRTFVFLVHRSLSQEEPHPDPKPFIYSLVASFSTCILSAYHLPGPVLGAGNKVIEKRGTVSALTEQHRRHLRSQASTSPVRILGAAECLGMLPLREDFLEDRTSNLRHKITKKLMATRSLGRGCWVEGCDQEDNERKHARKLYNSLKLYLQGNWHLPEEKQ